MELSTEILNIYLLKRLPYRSEDSHIYGPLKGNPMPVRPPSD